MRYPSGVHNKQALCVLASGTDTFVVIFFIVGGAKHGIFAGTSCRYGSTYFTRYELLD